MCFQLYFHFNFNKRNKHTGRSLRYKIFFPRTMNMSMYIAQCTCAFLFPQKIDSNKYACSSRLLFRQNKIFRTKTYATIIPNQYLFVSYDQITCTTQYIIKLIGFLKIKIVLTRFLLLLADTKLHVLDHNDAVCIIHNLPYLLSTF